MRNELGVVILNGILVSSKPRILQEKYTIFSVIENEKNAEYAIKNVSEKLLSLIESKSG